MSRSVFEKPLIPQELLIQKIQALTSRDYKRDRALIACLSLGGFRISEVVGIKCKDYLPYLRKKKKRLQEAATELEGSEDKLDKKRLKKVSKELSDVDRMGRVLRKRFDKDPQAWFVEPLRKYQCKKIIENVGGVEYKFLQFEQVTVLKRKGKITPKKSPAFPYHKEKALIKIFWEYIEPLPDDKILFLMTRRHALRIVKQCLGDDYFNHYLRHLRITRLFGPKYNLTEQQAKKIIGSKDTRSFEPYSHLMDSDLRNKMV